MSLLLIDQKLGAHSQPDAKSHKFILKGRQTGGMHRGHSWVFRAETYDTMLAWFDDIKAMTETSGEERNAYVRGHSRSFSRASTRSVSSFDDDEADTVPYNSNHASVAIVPNEEDQRPQRPVGGRFPSDLQIRKDGMTRQLTPSSDGGSEINQDVSTAAGGLVSIDDNQMATASHVNGENSLLGATRRGPAFETPIPVIAPSPESQQAEFATTTPHRSLADVSRLVAATPLQGTNASTTSLAGSKQLSPIEQAAPVESNAWLDASQPTTAPVVVNAVAHTTEDTTAAESKPDMRRNDTGQTISNLHVPGEYPKTPMGERSAFT